MEIIDQRKYDVYTLTLKDNGILYTHTSDERTESLEELKKTIQIIGEMVNYKKVPVLNTRGGFALPSSEIRSFWAQKDSFPYGSAEAYLLPSLALRLVGNAYKVVDKPARPTNFFLKEDEAIAWLKTFL